ncbi:MAG: hypothetical protein KGM94_06645, partial [Bradyrhizobium sp.]|nr:hypothetical protein [Bradyrhizobium sp.]
MNGRMSPSRGCFDRCDDEPDTNEYASPPCYMHEVDPSYFGLAPPPDRNPRDPELIPNAPARMR